MTGDEAVIVGGPVRGLQGTAPGRGLVCPRVPGSPCLRAVTVPGTRRGAVATVTRTRRLGLGDPGAPGLLMVTATPMSPPRVVTTAVLRHVHEALLPARGRVEAELVDLTDNAADIILPGVSGGLTIAMMSPVQEGRGVGHQGSSGAHVYLALVSVQHPGVPVVRRADDVTIPRP